MTRMVVLGKVIHSVKFGELQCIEKGAVLISENGFIENVIDLNKNPNEKENIFRRYGRDQILDYSDRLIIPGFVDAHCHAPQYAFSGTGMDLPLLQWLETYTFPCEAKFSDLDFAKEAYTKSIRRHLKCGTTFASYFGTIDLEGCKVLAEAIQTAGQRAYIGKVCMDQNAPHYYVEDTSQSSKETEEFIHHILSLTDFGLQHLKKCSGMELGSGIISPSNLPVTDDSDDNSERSYSGITDSDTMSSESTFTFPQIQMRKEFVSSNYYGDGDLLNKPETPLIIPCVTPRFVPTCSAEMLTALGALASKYRLPMQSHLSESLDEIAWVKSMHPDCATYAGVYEKFNLLGKGAYLAHCCHSNEEEMSLLAKHESGVVHCASSNFMLTSGVMDLKKFIKLDIKAAIGTDVAGGYSPSMLDAIRQTIIASKVVLIQQQILKRQQQQQLKKSEDLDTKEETNYCADKSDVNLILQDSHEKSAALDDTATQNSLTYAEAFHLATLGGAEVLNMDKVVGNFAIGKSFDALVINMDVKDSPIDVFGHEHVMELFQKFIFLGDDRNIERIFVQGRGVL